MCAFLFAAPHSRRICALQQNYIREQVGSNYSFNLVKQTLVYLDEVCGGAQSLGLFINEGNADIVIQCLRVWDTAHCVCSSSPSSPFLCPIHITVNVRGQFRALNTGNDDISGMHSAFTDCPFSMLWLSPSSDTCRVLSRAVQRKSGTRAWTTLQYHNVLQPAPLLWDLIPRPT